MKTNLRPGAINFVWLYGRTYPEVQHQIFNLIEAQLPPGVVSHTVEDGVAGALNLSLFIRQGREDHARPVAADVIMAHGIADKRYFFIRDSDTELPLANQYSYLFVPGSWHVNRLIEGRYRRNPHYQITVEESQIKKVGWLRLDPLVAAAKSKDGEPHHRLRILWAPTHNVVQGKEENRSKSETSKEIAPSSLPGFKPYVKPLSAKYIFRASLHPRNRSNRKPTGNQLVWSDVVVSDFGTMVYEAWALGKPVIFPRWCMDVATIIERNPLSAESYIYRERIGLHPESYEEMLEMLDRIQGQLIGNGLVRFLKRLTRQYGKRKSGNDLRGPGVAHFVDHYVAPETRGNDAKRTADELVKIAHEWGLGV